MAHLKLSTTVRAPQEVVFQVAADLECVKRTAEAKGKVHAR